jgi:hypothetical protein
MSTKRSRDWAAYFSDSDEDGKVSIIASTDQNGAVSYSRHPAGMHSVSSVIVNDGAEPAESSSSGSAQTPVKAKPRKYVSIISFDHLYATKAT